MTRSSLLTLCLLISLSNAFSQKITGSITDPTGKPAEFVSVLLLKAKDSSLIKGAASEANGKYEIENIPAGRYFLSATIVGFAKTDSKTFDYDGGTYNADPITLKKSNTLISEVTITAAKPLIEVQADKLVFNVEASPTNTGLNALELLRKSPGVSLDQNDNIALKGKQNVIIQINGKTSPMSGDDLAQFLKGLNSADIEAIEIISNPGAKYDAEGNAGIINIRLKKDKKMGTNGSLNLGLYQGITPKADASISFNNRGTKLNIFGSASIFRGIRGNTLFIDNQIGANDTRYIQNSNTPWFAKPQNARFGMDYSPNKTSTVGFLITSGLFVPTNTTLSTTNIGKLSSGSIDSILSATTTGRIQSWNTNFNLNYKFADTLGNSLNLDADYGIYRDSSMTLNINSYLNGATEKLMSYSAYRMFTPRDINVKTFKADYDRPLSIGAKNNVKLGAGFKISEVNTDNRFKFYDILNTADVLDTDRSNNFTYLERITAGYLNLNTKINKFSVQLGLRVEHTDSKGNLEAFKTVNNKTVDTTYTNFFPSVALGYELSKNVAFNLTYRYSVDRPRYQDLNPFEYRLDELSYRRGNPFLRPQFTQSIELGTTLFQRANITVNYAKTNDAFAQISDQAIDPTSGKQIFYIQKRNLATLNNFGVTLTTPIPINKWWTGNANLYYNYSILQANYGEGRVLDIKVNGGGFWMQQVFTLSKTLTAEVSGWGSIGGTWGAYIMRPQGVMDIGMSQKIWDGNGTIRLSLGDVFGTSRWSAYTSLGTLYIDSHGTWEGRQLKANFTYRFGNKNVQKERNRKTGLEEESNRANGN